MELTRWIITEEGLRGLLLLLGTDGFTVIGPRLRDGAICFGPLSDVDDLPRGRGDRQKAASYELRERNDQAWFGYTTSPHSAKRTLFPERQKIGAAEIEGEEVTWTGEVSPPRRYAFLGLRPCDAHAIRIQDRIFLGQHIRDTSYERNRSGTLLIVVQCGEAGGTCFCSSMNSGPRATDGFDIALTEILEGGRHFFVAEQGSEEGALYIETVASRTATDADWDLALECTANAERTMGRCLDAGASRNLLANSYEHPHWDDVASRCLSCTNCTMVCPTCFCSGIEELSGLSLDRAERWRRWSSCFECEFSHIHGCVVRPDTRSQYRQWLTHKLGTWHDQFGMSGCVGCGRCITWCPVGIDITEEVQALF